MIGVVAIGRNEGRRLIRCLQSALRDTVRIVYVDSNSTDNSVVDATALGVEVVRLDPSQPFSAARGRNAGFERLVALYPEIEFVQFVDGDCEIADGWIKLALESIRRNESIAVICGRRKEREPTRNAYHQLIDLEWDTPCGEVAACGGDALIRRIAFEKVGGLDPTIIAGEEPEFCARLRQAGYKIHRIDHDMTIHDISMNRFRQWWRRSLRSGFGAADVAHRLRDVGDVYFAHQLRSAWLWGGVFPLASVVMAAALIPLGMSWALMPLAGCLLLYFLQLLRIARGLSARGVVFPNNLSGAWLLLASKPAQVIGQLQFIFSSRHRANRSAIEYK
jgi:glycosyltransferase involved in cell wall biosynthesis